MKKTNPEKETLNEKDNPEQTKRSATGTPMAGGTKNELKHEDDANKPDAQLNEEAQHEFEEHNMNQNMGYNEAGSEQEVPVEKKNLTGEKEKAQKNNS